MGNIKFICSACATAIDNNFIDNYMAEAPSPVFSLIYIYAYRCAVAGVPVSNADIASKFNIIESDVIKAWRYWKDMGVVNTGGTLAEPILEFNVKQKTTANDSVRIVADKPSYSPGDISNIIRDNSEVGELLKVAEETKGKTLSPKETEIIVWLYDGLELTFEVIIVLLSFCYKNNKPVRYVEKIAVDWAEKGISTSEAAGDYLSYYDNYGKVLKSFGISGRSASAGERKHIDKWIKEWNMSMELIELAARRTVDNTGKAAFSYCNKILESWHNSGYKTVNDVENAEAQYIKKGTGQVKKGNIRPPSGVFSNYSQRTYSDKEIEEILKRKGNM